MARIRIGRLDLWMTLTEKRLCSRYNDANLS